MSQRAYGFTIVELLIVIVVIAILATLSYVGYTNLTLRAENTKTIVAAEAYLKAISMYKAEKGDVPKMTDGSCLGRGYPWEYEGLSSGDNQCRSASVSYYFTKGAINDELERYLGSLPQPSMKVVGSPVSWRRGISYSHTGVGGHWVVQVAFFGDMQCPVLSGSAAALKEALDGGMSCIYRVGLY